MRILLSLLFILSASMSSAQDRPSAILVLDASGSMWGQIDGVAKITIAQTVVGDLLETLPDDQALGLTAYGHRRKGDCSDIETLIQPGAGQRDAIADAVNSLSPRGKTPLTAAVIAAAEALKYTEEAATVILVSDGKETCEFDPCAIGKQLEETGVDFTAHVIGFDIDDPADRAELQCLAEETGGTFRLADNADELAAAMTVVAAAPAPPPEPATVTFAASEGPNGPRISTPLSWSLVAADGTSVAAEDAPRIVRDLEAGLYTARVTRPEDGATAQADVTVTSEDRLVVLVLPELPPEPVSVRVTATDGENGRQINEGLLWTLTGPDGVVLQGEPGGPLTVDLVKGTYTVSVLRLIDEETAELRFGVGSVNKQVQVALPEYRPLAELVAPDSAPAGSLIQVEWRGPAADGDFITVAEPDRDGGGWIEYALTRDGTLLDLRMPPTPGTYQVRYVLADGRKVLASKPIEATPVTASITVPDGLTAGSTITIDWTGPDYKNDSIAIVEQGETRWINNTLTREGSPMEIVLPPEPGSYEIVYSMGAKRTELVRDPIEVAAVGAQLVAPDQATAGDSITVEWTGPDYQNDFVAVVPTGEERWVNYTYTREGSPLDVMMPTDEGAYELVYMLGQDRTVIARRPIEVVAVGATLSASDQATAGASVTVEWTGPDYRNDFIAVTERGADRWINYTYTREGAPLNLVMPTEEGEYDIVYFLNQDNTPIARVPVTVGAVSATLAVPETLEAGATVTVDWTGPDYQNDFIAVTERGSDKWINYTYTRDGTPLGLQLPAEAGDYDIVYFLRQDNRPIARIPVTTAAVSFSVMAPDSAPAGSTIQVDWTGPDYKNDYVSLAEVGVRGNQYETYQYTNKGSPAEIKLPITPGTYEIRYIVNQDAVIGATRTIEVTPVTATVAAPETALAGSKVTVDWTGPDYKNDYVTISKPDDAKYEAYTYTNQGSPLQVQAPAEPGTYEIRYFAQGRPDTILARIPLEVLPVTATLKANGTVAPGGNLAVEWEGPDYKSDYISIAKVGDTRYETYTYTNEGSPLIIKAPDGPGTYELRYVMQQGDKVLASQTLVVE